MFVVVVVVSLSLSLFSIVRAEVRKERLAAEVGRNTIKPRAIENAHLSKPSYFTIPS
jgi:hypothetical protein